MGICCASIKETPSDIYSPDIDPKKTESQDADSDEIESLESPDLDTEDKQIYEGNFENVSAITQSEIRIFLSSTFKGKIIKNFKLIYLI